MLTTHTKSAKPKALTRLRLTLWLAALILSVLTGIAPAYGQNDTSNIAAIEIVSLQHRDANTIREAIAPFLDPRGALSQIDNKLIISTSADNLRQLTALISELDVPRLRLKISVDFQYSPTNQTLEDGAQITTATTMASTATVLSLILNEGEYAYFSEHNDTPSVSSVLTDQGLLLNQAQSLEGKSFAVTAQSRGDRYSLELTTLQSQTDIELVTASREITTNIEIEGNAWFVLNQANDLTTSDTRIFSTEASELIAIKVELMP